MISTFSLAPLHPPTNVKCSNTSSTSLAVQWQAPSMLGMGTSFIRGYEVFFKPGGVTPPKRNVIFACNSSLNITAVDLKKYTEYEILVTAFNGAGPGKYSNVTHCFTDEDSK